MESTVFEGLHDFYGSDIVKNRYYENIGQILWKYPWFGQEGANKRNFHGIGSWIEYLPIASITDNAIFYHTPVANMAYSKSIVFQFASFIIVQVLHIYD